MKNIRINVVLLFIPFFSVSQNVGIGTTAPTARLHVADSSVVFSAPWLGGSPGNTRVMLIEGMKEQQKQVSELKKLIEQLLQNKHSHLNR